MPEQEIFSQSASSQEDAWLYGKESARGWFTGSLNAEDELDLSAEFDAKVTGLLGAEVARALASLEAGGTVATHAGLRLQAGMPLDVFTGAGMFARARMEASVTGEVAVSTRLSLSVLASAVLDDTPAEVRPYFQIVLDEATVKAGVWARGAFAAMAVGELEAVFALFPTNGGPPGVTANVRYGYAWGWGGGWGTTVNIGFDTNRVVARICDQIGTDLLRALERYRQDHPVDDDSALGWLLSAADILLPSALQVMTSLAQTSLATKDAEALSGALNGYCATLPMLVGRWLAPRLASVCTEQLLKDGLAGLGAQSLRTLWSAIDTALLVHGRTDGSAEKTTTGSVVDAAGAILAAAAALPPATSMPATRALRCLVATLLLTEGTEPPSLERLRVIFADADLHTKSPQAVAAAVLENELAALLSDHAVLPDWMDDLLGGAGAVAAILMQRQAMAEATAIIQRLTRLLSTVLLDTPAWQEVSGVLPPDIRSAVRAAAHVLEEFAGSDLTTHADVTARRMREGLSVSLLTLVGVPLARLIDFVANTGLRSGPAAFRALADQANNNTMPPLSEWTWGLMAREAVGVFAGLPASVLLDKTAATAENWCNTRLPDELSFLRRSLTLGHVCARIPEVGTRQAIREYKATLLPTLGEHMLNHLVGTIEFAVNESKDLFLAVVKSSFELMVRSIALSTAATFAAIEASVAAAEQVGVDLQKHADELEGQIAGYMGMLLIKLRTIADTVRNSTDQLESRLVSWITDTALAQGQGAGLPRGVVLALVQAALDVLTANLADSIRHVTTALADALDVGAASLIAVAESPAGLSMGLRKVAETNWRSYDLPTVTIPFVIWVPNPLAPHILPDIQINVGEVTLPAELVGQIAMALLMDALGVGPLLTALDHTVLTMRATRGALAQTRALIAGRQQVARQRQALNSAKPSGQLSVEIVSPQPSSATGPSGNIAFVLHGANLSFANPGATALPPEVPKRIQVLINGNDVTSDVTWRPVPGGLRGTLAYTTSAREHIDGSSSAVFVIPPVAVLVAVVDGQGVDEANATWSFVPEALTGDLIVSCIIGDRSDRDRSIDAFGGTTGAAWRLALGDALALHDRGTHFFIRGPGNRLIPLRVVAAGGGHARHFQAMPNQGATLYGLPECEPA